MFRIEPETKLAAKGIINPSVIEIIKQNARFKNEFMISDLAYILRKTKKYVQERIITKLMKDGIINISKPNGSKQLSTYSIIKKS
jgi:predicted TIM-barrel enzyme